MKFSRAYIVDLVERVVFTYLESLFGLWVAAGLNINSLVTDLAVYQKAAVAVAPTVLALIKGLVASQVGNKGSAAFIPKSPTQQANPLPPQAP